MAHTVSRESKFKTGFASLEDQLDALHPLAFGFALGVRPVSSVSHCVFTYEDDE